MSVVTAAVTREYPVRQTRVGCAKARRKRAFERENAFAVDDAEYRG